MTFVDSDFGRAEEVRGTLDLTDYAFAEAGTDVASVFRLQELNEWCRLVNVLHQWKRWVTPYLDLMNGGYNDQYANMASCASRTHQKCSSEGNEDDLSHRAMADVYS